MKILLLAFLCISINSFSQMGVPFPTSNAGWINRVQVVDPNQSNYGWYSSDTYKITEADTLIGNQTYSKLNFCYPCSYCGALREENNKIYYIPKDSIAEYLVYDFGVVVGQTLYNVFAQPYDEEWSDDLIISELVVSSIDTVVYGGQQRVEIRFNQYPDVWIEGIGNIGGFLHKFYVNVSGYYTYLDCFSIADQKIFPSSMSVSCFSSIGIKDLNFSDGLDLYPNPNNGTFKLKSEIITIGQLKVLDLMGREIYFKSEFATGEEININVNSGTYIVHFKSENHIYKQKIVVE